MFTNDLKKGTEIVLRNGWKATIEDNKKGNIRLAKVHGVYSELGSIYSFDIMKARIGDSFVDIVHTDKQMKHMRDVYNLKF